MSVKRKRLLRTPFATCRSVLILASFFAPMVLAHPNTVWNVAELSALQANSSKAGWSDLYSGRVNATDQSGANLLAFAQRFGAPTATTCTNDQSCDSIATANCKVATGHCFTCNAAQTCQGASFGAVKPGAGTAGYAMIAQLTGKAANVGAAQDLLRAMCGLPNSHNYTFGWPANADQEEADPLVEASIAFDVLFAAGGWQSGELAACADTIHSHAQSFDSAIAGNTQFWVNEPTNDHEWEDASALGIAGQALEQSTGSSGQSYDVDAQTFEADAATNLRQVYQVQDLVADGSWHEGPGYYITGMLHLVPYWIGVRRRAPDTFTDDMTQQLQNYGQYIYYLQQPDHPHVPVMFASDHNWLRPGILPVLRWAAQRYAVSQPAAAAFAQAAADRFTQDQSETWLHEFDYATFFALEFVAYQPITATLPPAVPLDHYNADQQSFVMRNNDNADASATVGIFKAGVFGGSALNAACQQSTPPFSDVNFSHEHEDALGIWIYGQGGWQLPEAEGYNCCYDAHDTPDPGGSPNDKEHSSPWHNVLEFVTSDGATHGQLGDDKITTRLNDALCGTTSNIPWFNARSSTMTLHASTDDYSFARADGSALYDSSLGLGSSGGLLRTFMFSRALDYFVLQDTIRSTSPLLTTARQIFHGLNNPTAKPIVTNSEWLPVDNSVSTVGAQFFVSPATTVLNIGLVNPSPSTQPMIDELDDDGFATFFPAHAPLPPDPNSSGDGAFSDFFSRDGRYTRIRIPQALTWDPVQHIGMANLLDVFWLQSSSAAAAASLTPLDVASPQSGFTLTSGSSSEAWIFNVNGTSDTVAGGLRLSGGSAAKTEVAVVAGPLNAPTRFALSGEGSLFSTASTTQPLLNLGTTQQTIEVSIAGTIATLSGSKLDGSPPNVLGISFYAPDVTTVKFEGGELGTSSGSGTITIKSLSRAPVVSNFKLESIGPSVAAVSWDTDRPSNTQFSYSYRVDQNTFGTVTLPVADADPLVLHHSAQLSALIPQLDYGIDIHATAADGSVGEFNASGFMTTMLAGRPTPANFSVEFGTGGDEAANAVTVDSSGSIYIAGYTTGSLPGCSPACSNSAGTGTKDAFVRKMSSNGTVLWTTEFGTSDDDVINAIAIDETNSLLVAVGTTKGILHGVSRVPHTDEDIFVESLRLSDGSRLRGTQLGTDQDDEGNGVAVDPSGDVYVTGISWGSFPGRTNPGHSAIFAKFTSDLPTAPAWLTQYVGTNSGEYLYGAALDHSGNLYAAGATDLGSATYLPTLYRTDIATGGSVTQTTLSNTDPVTQRTVFNCAFSMAYAVAVDASDNAYVTGSCSDQDETHFALGLWKYSKTNAVVFANWIGDATEFNIGQTIIPNGIALDGNGDVYVAAYGVGPIFGASNGPWLHEALLVEFNGKDGTLVYGNELGTVGNDALLGVAADTLTGNVDVAGYVGGAMPLCSPSVCTFAGGKDVFVAQFQPNTTNNSAVGDTHFKPARSMMDLAQSTTVDPTIWSTGLPDGTGAITESNGAITLSPAAGVSTSSPTLTSMNKHDLIKSSATVKVLGVVSATGNVNTIFRLHTDWNNEVAWWYEAGTLYAVYILNGVEYPVAALDYDSAVHVWWRIRESDGSVYWETSPDGTFWTQQGSVRTSALFSLVSLDVLLTATEFGTGNAAPGAAKYTAINAP